MNQVVVDIRDASVRFNLNIKKNVGMKEYVRTMFLKERRFQEFYALKGVNLQIRKGESWGFVGRNGSGKSTLLKLVSGILRPYNGTANTVGTIAPLLELGAGFDPELTGRENIYMNGLILGMNRKFIDAHFDEIVDFSEIGQFLDVPIKNYSSGMKSRLGFAVATAIKPDILIADEVLATGDKLFQQKCEKRMTELLSGGTTLLYVSHTPGAILEMCTHAMWLREGHVHMQGDAQAVCGAYEAVGK